MPLHRSAQRYVRLMKLLKRSTRTWFSASDLVNDLRKCTWMYCFLPAKKWLVCINRHLFSLLFRMLEDLCEHEIIQINFEEIEEFDFPRKLRWVGPIFWHQLHFILICYYMTIEATPWIENWLRLTNEKSRLTSPRLSGPIIIKFHSI